MAASHHYRLIALGASLLLAAGCNGQANPEAIRSAMNFCNVTHGRIEAGNEPDEGQSDYRLGLGPSTEDESGCINQRLEAQGFEPIMIVGDGPAGHSHT